MKKEQYSIGEVARMVKTQSHTIRFWVNELNQYIQPTIGKGDRRYFTEQHIEALKTVNKLINEQGFTIGIIKKNGIKNTYEEESQEVKCISKENSGHILQELNGMQKEIMKMISEL